MNRHLFPGSTCLKQTPSSYRVGYILVPVTQKGSQCRQLQVPQIHRSGTPEELKNHLAGTENSGGQRVPVLTLSLGHMHPKVYAITPEHIVRVDI